MNNLRPKGLYLFWQEKISGNNIDTSILLKKNVSPKFMERKIFEHILACYFFRPLCIDYFFTLWHQGKECDPIPIVPKVDFFASTMQKHQELASSR